MSLVKNFSLPLCRLSENFFPQNFSRTFLNFWWLQWLQCLQWRYYAIYRRNQWLHLMNVVVTLLSGKNGVIAPFVACNHLITALPPKSAKKIVCHFSRKKFRSESKFSPANSLCCIVNRNSGCLHSWRKNFCPEIICAQNCVRDFLHLKTRKSAEKIFECPTFQGSLKISTACLEG